MKYKEHDKVMKSGKGVNPEGHMDKVTGKEKIKSSNTGERGDFERTDRKEGLINVTLEGSGHGAYPKLKKLNNLGY